MKKLYGIYLSDDGHHPFVYSNVKALYKGIILTGYKPEFLDVDDTIPFTYTNLLKIVKESPYMVICTINCDENSAKIEVYNLTVKSK